MAEEKRPRRVRYPEDYGRKVDTIAPPTDTVETLRRHRESMESGDAESLHPTVENIPAKDRPHGSGKFTMEEIKKGYRCLK